MCQNPRLIKDYETEIRFRIDELGEEPDDPVEWRTWCINRHLPTVIAMARVFYSQAPAHVSFMDMVQEGNIGLVEEVDKFISAGRKGMLFPEEGIKAHIKDFLRREKNHVPQPQPQLSLFA